MTKLGALATLALGLFVVGCNEEAEDVELRSLQASTEMTFVCRDRYGHGVPRSECPDFDTVPPDPPRTRLFSLVTQTATDEVAVVDLLTAQVYDVDKSMPGFSFLRMPSRPGDIVTTPGGAASFVGLTGVGKTGIAAIPSSCIDPPFYDQTGRDVTTFPACSLPSKPADMVVLVEPPASDGIHESCDPNSPIEVQQTLLLPESPFAVPTLESVPSGAIESIAVCDGVEVLWTGPKWCGDYNDPEYDRDPLLVDPLTVTRCPQPDAPETKNFDESQRPGLAPEECYRVRDCGANLTAEGGPRGRRKLVVALPDEGRIVVIDAQRLLDRPQGSFGECEIEASYTLSSVVDPAGATQPDPEGLHPDTCEISRPPLPPNPPSYTAQPTGMAALDGRLYVADQGVPLVHVLDVSSPCNLNELPPLLPMSFEDPTRVVTTSRVAVSPLTPSGKRFVYALDQDDRPTASLMAFDVSPGSTDRTPIVRSGSLYLPGEQPDRIQFLSPVGDVTFALRDLPREDPDTGVATGGLMCDPNPAAESSEPGTLYRPSGDYTSGARPVLLRGLFGFAMLTSGEVAVIDVEDFDAPCRRPLETNPLGSPDFRGCAGDVDEYGYPLPAELKTPDGRLTVTDEVTCNMVSPHRPRALYPGAVSASAGQSAPSLRAFPQFSMRDESSQIPESAKPRLLAVPFRSPDPYKPEGEPPEVYVGNTLYRGDGVAAALLQTDPNSTEQSTLALPMSQPRNYASVEGVSVTYEGRIMGFQQNGMFDFEASSPSGVDTIKGTLTDSSAGFCDRGVYDREMMEKYAVAEFTAAGLSDAEVGRFAEFHSDYVQITGDFPDAYDPYWVEYGDLACGGRKGCLESFGSYTATSLDPRRELKIVEAYQDHLVVKPRVIEVLGDNPTQEDLDAVDALAHRIDCCFPGGTQYTIRSPNQWVMVSDAGVFRHDVVARKITEDEARPGLPLGSYRCDRDCDPRKAFNRSRAFEITSNAACEEAGNCTVGSPRSKALDPCSYDPTGQDDQGALVTRGVNLTDEAAAACIVESLTARFAVYRGLQPSVRDMRFHWEAVGGFAPLNVSLTARSSSVLPQRIEYVPELQSLFVTDAAALGLSLAPLDTLRVEDPWPVF